MTYVYSHALDGKVFYIGAGLPQRPSNLSARNHEWLKIVGNRTGEIVITIIAKYRSRKQALDAEQDLIKQLRPRGNICGNPDFFRPRRLPFGSGMRIIGIAMDRDLYSKIKTAADADYRTVSQFVRLILERSLEQKSA